MVQSRQLLTEPQTAAVEHFEGPLLVVAGPGSGKTRVMTHRIARLVDRGVNPRSILAITFTNKAAGELAERTRQLLPGAAVQASTFHRFCARLLRRYPEVVGLSSSYTILDTSDQVRLMRQVLNDLDMDAVHYPPARILQRISKLKNDLVTVPLYVSQYEERTGSHIDAIVARVYPVWQQTLARANSVDFDDLLMHVVTMLAENPELRSELDQRYEFILVDEYQDTNLAQYEIIRSLSRDLPNLCVTGDPDQSIYGWRGAQIENILRFESDFPGAKVIRLEQNFRSTGAILRAADMLIAHNRRRKAKSLLTDAEDGLSVELLTADDGRHEAETVARDIAQLVEQGDFRWSDVAIFYRVNSLSREMERALARLRIPCQMAAGVAFYDRAEIRDLLAYLRLIANPAEISAFSRIVNVPARGIGKTTQQRLRRWAEQNALTIMDAARKAAACPGLNRRAIKAIERFVQLYDGLADLAPGPVCDLLTEVIRRTRYAEGWQSSDREEDLQREANVQELVTAAAEYDAASAHESDRDGDAAATEDPAAGSLDGFLETTSLASEVDSLDPDAGSVTLMTLHAAKGLEFPVVYVLGVEQNLLPHERSLKQAGSSSDEIEEERRLLFVGMTRAMRKLTFTQTRERVIRGRPLRTIRSEFLAETEFVERDVSQGGDFDIDAFQSAGYGNRSAQDGLLNPEEKYLETSGEESQWPGHVQESAAAARGTDAEAPGSEPPAETQTERPERRRKLPIQDPRLKTGADLLEDKQAAVAGLQSFAAGMAVRHPTYGLGTVTETGGSPHKPTVTVTFRDDARTQTFMAAKCPLQPVGLR